MSDPYLRDLTPEDCAGTRWIVLQRWAKQACINAGKATTSSDLYLRDLTPVDSDATRAMVLQRWFKQLSS